MTRWRYPMEETWVQRNDYWIVPLGVVVLFFGTILILAGR